MLQGRGRSHPGPVTAALAWIFKFDWVWMKPLFVSTGIGRRMVVATPLELRPYLVS